MKKFLLATAALAAIGAAQPAGAADLGYRAPYQPAPYAAPFYNWTGFYVGAHVGGVFSSDNNFSGLTTGNNGNGRLLGGLQAGADWQFSPNWVAGIEGQYSWLSGNVGAVFPGGFVYTNSVEPIEEGETVVSGMVSGIIKLAADEDEAEVVAEVFDQVLRLVEPFGGECPECRFVD